MVLEPYRKLLHGLDEKQLLLDLLRKLGFAPWPPRALSVLGLCLGLGLLAGLALVVILLAGGQSGHWLDVAGLLVCGLIATIALLLHHRSGIQFSEPRGHRFRLDLLRRRSSTTIRLTEVESPSAPEEIEVPSDLLRVSPFERDSRRPALYPEALRLLARGMRRFTGRAMIPDRDPDRRELAVGLTLLGEVAQRLGRRGYRCAPRDSTPPVLGAMLRAVTPGGPLTTWLASRFLRGRGLPFRSEGQPDLVLTDRLEGDAYTIVLEGPAGVHEASLAADRVLGPDLELVDARAVEDAVDGLLAQHGFDWPASGPAV